MLQEDISRATVDRLRAERILKDAPFGVAGVGECAVWINSNPAAEAKLRPYRRHPVPAGS